MDAPVRAFVRQRANDQCEYCGLPQSAAPLIRFHVEHIIARKHGGTDDPSNLALACYHCNLHKGPNIAGIDPETGLMTPLFNPREQSWHEHFEVWGSSIIGRTPTGRATVLVLAMNSDNLRELRIEVSPLG
jgi:hypothetical protein